MFERRNYEDDLAFIKIELKEAAFNKFSEEYNFIVIVI